MFGAYIDDTGSDVFSPFMLLVALVAEKGAWDAFSEEWQAALDADKPIAYFKSHDAATLSGCFAGFTRDEADAKTEMLTDITLGHIKYGMASGIVWQHFNNILAPDRPKPPGTKRYFLKHPYFVTFHDIISCVGQCQVKLCEEGKVDFMFDQQGKWYLRCKRLFDELMPQMPKICRNVYGSVYEGDDKVHLPLQAADLIGGQTRYMTMNPNNVPTRSYTKIYESRKLFYNQIMPAALRDFIRRDFNLLLEEGESPILDR
jgi:hypothetical protein